MSFCRCLSALLSSSQRRLKFARGCRRLFLSHLSFLLTEKSPSLNYKVQIPSFLPCSRACSCRPHDVVERSCGRCGDPDFFPRRILLGGWKRRSTEIRGRGGRGAPYRLTDNNSAKENESRRRSWMRSRRVTRRLLQSHSAHTTGTGWDSIARSSPHPA